jgi:hypothetical protein
VYTLPVQFAGSMTTNPLVNTATANDPASATVATASDSNVILPRPTNPIPVENRWALSLLALLILLGSWRQAQREVSRR